MKTIYTKRKLNMTKKMGLLMLCLSMSISSMAQVIADGTYKIFNSVHSEVMTTETSGDFNALMDVPNATDDFQLWTFTHQGNDVYIIENEGSGNTLGIKDNWCGQFGDVWGKFSTTDSNVEFKVRAADVTDTYVIEIAFTTCNFGSQNDPIKAFDIENGASGGQIQTFDVDTSNPNQQFEIVLPSTLNLNEFNAETVDMFYQKNDRHIKISNLTSESTININIFDINGKLVKDIKDKNVQNNFDINVQSFENGLYFVRLQSNNKFETRKILIH